MNLFHEAKKVLDKDGKVNPLGPYGKQKLTGRETSAYFRRNKVSDAQIKKAVEVALDLGGAMDIASKEIKKFYGDKILKAKEVQNALRYANEEVIHEGSFYGRDDLVKQFATPKKDKHLYVKLRKTDSKGTSGVSMKRKGNEKKIADYKKDGYKEVPVESMNQGHAQTYDNPLKGYPYNENYRKLAVKGMGAEDKKSIKVGTEVDYYEPKQGNKRQGKVTKMTPKGYTVQDMQDRKTHTFMYHDRMKAKSLMASVKESVEKIIETKKQEVDAMKKISKDMQTVLKAYQKVSSMGDKTLKDTKHNASYKKVLDARDAILTMIGTLNTQMLLTKEETNLWKELCEVNTITEKFRPYNDKNYPRCVDFYIQFRGGKGDRITSPENKKDFIKATDMIDAYCKKNKIKQKPVYSTPMEGSSAYKVGLMIDKSYSKTSDYDDGKDLQPLYVALSKLKTAEDHGGGWSVMVPKGLGPVKEAEVEEGKDKIKYRGNLKGLMDSKDMKEETESLLVQHFIKEAMSKKMDIKKYAGKVGFDKAEIKWIIDNEEEDHYENNSAMKNEWIALSYPIRSGDYYFAFIGDRMTDEKISQVNQKMNDLLRKEKVKAEKMTFDDEPYNEDMVASHLWNYMSAQFQKLPASLGAEDTMTRECLYTAIKHLTDDGEIMFEHTLAEGMFKNLAKGMLGKIRNKLRKVKRTIKLGKKAVIKASKEMSHEEAKYKANKSVMDTYKNMWEEELKEEMITYRVKKMHPAEKKKFEQSGRQMGLKVTMNTNQQDTLVVMSGTKKKLRDFDSVARGKSSYGDPSTVKHFDEED